MPTIEEVVLLIHGIRDFAEWQDMVATVLSEIPNIEVCPLKYGRFDAFRFWFPIWTREAPVKNLLWRIRSAHDRFSPAKMSVVAHSFGTYAIGNILRGNPDIRLHRLILCGAILPSNFRWDQIQRGVDTPIINDCGIKDIWPVLAQSTTFGYGPSGRFGFGTPGVRDRYHDFGHGGFFQEKFVSDFWLPWFRSGYFVKSKAPPPSGARWHLLTLFPIKWLALLLCVLGFSSSIRSAWIGPKTEKPPASTGNVVQASNPDHVSVPLLEKKPVLTRPTANFLQIEVTFEKQALPLQSALWIQVAADASFRDLLLNENIPYPLVGSTVNKFRYAEHVWARLVIKDANKKTTGIGDSVSLDASR